jgi:aminopeptidase N
MTTHPTCLDFVDFHLYQNAFIKGSHLQHLELANKEKSAMGKKEAAGLGIQLDKIQVNGVDVKTKLDNTIMKVYLPTPLKPGAKV